MCYAYFANHNGNLIENMMAIWVMVTAKYKPVPPKLYIKN